MRFLQVHEVLTLKRIHAVALRVVKPFVEVDGGWGSARWLRGPVRAEPDGGIEVWHDDETLDDVAKLSHISGPCM